MKVELSSAAVRLAGACCVAGLLLCQGCGRAERDEPTGPVAAASSPGHGTAHLAAVELEAARTLFAAARYDAAADQYTRVLAKIPGGVGGQGPSEQLADVYFQRGLAYFKMGFPDTAAADFSEVISLAPQHGAAFEQRGLALLELGDSYKALRDLTQAIRLQSENAGAYHARGLIYLRREQYQRAVADLEQAGKKDSALVEATRARRAEAHLRWSQQLAAGGEQVLAAEQLAKARQLNAGSVEDHALPPAAPAAGVEQIVAKPVIDGADELLLEGRTRQQAGEFDQAILAYTKIIQERPDFAEAYLRRGETLLTMGFPDTALEDLKQAARRGGGGETFRLQAQAYLKLESPHRAALAATEALHAEPTDAAAYELRGRAYLALEYWERAIADLQEAIRREPGRAEALQPQVAESRRRQAETLRAEADLQAQKE